MHIAYFKYYSWRHVVYIVNILSFPFLLMYNHIAGEKNLTWLQKSQSWAKIKTRQLPRFFFLIFIFTYLFFNLFLQFLADT